MTGSPWRYVSLRTLGLTLVACCLVVATVMLGLWQLGVYDEHQRADAEARLRRPPVPLDSLIGPDTAFPPDGVGIPVTAVGHYDATHQLYVRGYDGTSGRDAVVTPLVTRNGSAILVVRGLSASASAADRPPHGDVRLIGVLEPPADAGRPLNESRETNALDIAMLVPGIPEDLYAGYLVATTSTPSDPLAPLAPPLPDPSRWAGLRNLIYALQWWCFGGFVVFMWWRIIADWNRELPSPA